NVRGRKLHGARSKLLRSQKQSPGSDFVNLVVTCRRVDERDFFGIIRVVNKNGLSFIESQVSVQPGCPIHEFLIEAAIDAETQHAIVDKSEADQEHADGNRIEERQLRA